MNFNHLEYAAAVAKAGSIRKASQNLFVSQPYLSGMVKGLEDELGYRIFSRTATGVILTKERERFLDCARVILMELKKLREINAATDERELNIASYYATYVMEQFLKFHNASTYKFSDKIREMGNEEVMESVASGESTIGIIFFAPEKKQKYKKLIEKNHFHEELFLPPLQMYVFLHRTHPLAKMPKIKAENLNDYPFVIYNDKSSRNYLHILGIADHPQLLEVSDRGGFYDTLRSGEYLTTMAFWNPPSNGEYLAIPFHEKTYQLYSCCVTAQNYKLSKREKEFLEFLKK